MVREIVMEFAALTGLSPAGGAPPQRYLWTDAFAVCNFLELYRQSGEVQYRGLALSLVDQVHHVLGRHREDDPRTGWISGLDEQEGQGHPTKGGLRIGKELNERKPGDPFDERLEWERDGQYYHYLTRWMHALNGVSRVTGDSIYNRWAIELAKRCHAGFTHELPSGGPKRMYWKMSIDLSYPLVSSMGQHDPLDGWITYKQLQASAAGYPENSTGQNLDTEIADMARICEGGNWATDDPLGIGGLLSDACRVAQLIVDENFEKSDLIEVLLDSSLQGLGLFARKNPLRLPADYRLAFRELGLAIGLRAVERLRRVIERHPERFSSIHGLHSRIEGLMRYVPLGEAVERFWIAGANRETGTWMEHRNINMVMLATSLAPDGYLMLA